MICLLYTFQVLFKMSKFRYKPGIYTCFMTAQCTFEILLAVLQQNFDWDATTHRFWIARVFQLEVMVITACGVPNGHPSGGAAPAHRRRRRRRRRRHRGRDNVYCLGGPHLGLPGLAEASAGASWQPSIPLHSSTLGSRTLLAETWTALSNFRCCRPRIRI